MEDSAKRRTVPTDPASPQRTAIPQSGSYLAHYLLQDSVSLLYKTEIKEPPSTAVITFKDTGIKNRITPKSMEQHPEQNRRPLILYIRVVASTTTVDYLCPSLSKNRLKVTDKDKQNTQKITCMNSR